jgi:mannose PTS system EIIA component
LEEFGNRGSLAGESISSRHCIETAQTLLCAPEQVGNAANECSIFVRQAPSVRANFLLRRTFFCRHELHHKRLSIERVRSMIGMVLVTHGHLATEFRAALEHVVGPQKQVATVSIGPEDDMEQRRKDILDAVKHVDSGGGVVILTDMFGGTPSNLAISVMNGGHVEVVAGINLPMLIKLASVRDAASLEQAVIQAQDAGRKYIYIASRVLSGK